MNRFTFRKAWKCKNCGKSGFIFETVFRLAVASKICECQSCCITYGKPQQCLGVTDKNGRVIFEGDKLRDPDGSVRAVEWSNKNPRFILNCEGVRADVEIFFPINEMEIVGNVDGVAV